MLVPGCGSGYEVALLAEWGFDVTGLDYAPAATERTRKRLRSLLQSPAGARIFTWSMERMDTRTPTALPGRSFGR